MEGKIVLITGSTDGIGRQTALDLANRGATIWLHGKDPDRCRSTAEEIRSRSGQLGHRSFTADLADLGQVRRLIEEVLDAGPRIDVLILNAGVFRHRRELTADGVEMTFGVNHVAHFVSSMVQAEAIDFDNLQGEVDYAGFGAYARSKLCNVLFTRALAKRLEGSGVTANCLHPGVINTKLLRASWSGGAPVTEGAKTPVYLASSPEVEGVNGVYFVNRRPAPPAPISGDPDVQEQLWKISEELTGMTWPA
jgi:NAD(P)-dependent dehydrogenase (short-subunit alcohol dehydrogenase family)